MRTKGLEADLAELGMLQVSSAERYDPHDADHLAKVARLPSLALPFGLVGAAVGWLTGGALNGPLLAAATQPRVAERAALVAGLVGVAAGLVLRRIAQRQIFGALTLRRRLVGWAVVVTSGLLSGAAVDSLLPYSEGVVSSAVIGGLAAACAVPICDAVLAAARRAARARMGSLVAAADRRAVWATLATATALATAIAIPEWHDPIRRDPFGALAIAFGGLAVSSMTILLDLWTFGRLARLGRRAAAMAAIDRQQKESAWRVPTQDYGLGEDARGDLTFDSAYRHGPRLVALVLGDRQAAEDALRGGLRRKIAGLLALAAIVGLHLAVAFDPGLI